MKREEHRLKTSLWEATRGYKGFDPRKAISCWMAQISPQGKMETKLIDGKAIAALVTTLVQEGRVGDVQWLWKSLEHP